MPGPPATFSQRLPKGFEPGERGGKRMFSRSAHLTLMQRKRALSRDKGYPSQQAARRGQAEWEWGVPALRLRDGR